MKRREGESVIFIIPFVRGRDDCNSATLHWREKWGDGNGQKKKREKKNLKTKPRATRKKKGNPSYNGIGIRGKKNPLARKMKPSAHGLRGSDASVCESICTYIYASLCVFVIVSVYKRIGCRTSLQSRTTVEEVRERRSARRRFRRLIASERRLIEERINRATDGRSPAATPHLDRTRSRTQTRTNTRIHASFFFLPL